MTKRIKITVTAYYDVDMETAAEDYNTTDPDEMLAIDRKNAATYYAEEVLIWADTEPTVELNWEN